MSDSKRLLIHAGAGSGKTTTLIGIIMRLLQEGVSPERIMLLTFMRKSAEDMIARAARVISGASRIDAGTFHSVFGRHLMASGDRDLYRRLLADMDRFFLIRSAMKECKVSDKEIPVEDVATFLTYYKGKDWSPDQVIFNHDDKMGNIYYRYEMAKQRGKKIDYDDIISMFQSIAHEVGNHYDAILVDEFQDVNCAQMACLQAMLRPDLRFIAVGDPDQSIYAWRGSSPEYMIYFHDHFGPQAEIVSMGVNYRSHSQIVQCGRNVVSNNKERHDIDLYAIRDTASHHPVLLRPNDDREEAEVVSGLVENMVRNGHSADSIAILFRNGYYAEAMLTTLAEKDIAFRLQVDQTMVIYDKPIVRSFLAMMKAKKEPNDIDLLRQFGHLCYMGREQFAELPGLAKVSGRTLLEAIPQTSFKYGNSKANQLVRMIRYLPEVPQKAVEVMVRDYLGDHLLRQGTTGRIQLEELEYFADTVSECKTVAEVQKKANALRGAIEAAKRRDENTDAILLSTIHRAKGLEWDTVFVLGVSDTILPDDKSENLEEERRLCYVAVTRAKENLVVSSPTLFGGRRCERTFVKEMKWCR